MIDDVVKNMREEYLNEGADTEMLEELKTVWNNEHTAMTKWQDPAYSQGLIEPIGGEGM